MVGVYMNFNIMQQYIALTVHGHSLHFIVNVKCHYLGKVSIDAAVLHYIMCQIMLHNGFFIVILITGKNAIKTAKRKIMSQFKSRIQYDK